MLEQPPNGQFKYTVKAAKGVNQKVRDELDISNEDYNSWKRDPAREMPLTASVADELKEVNSVQDVSLSIAPEGEWVDYLFPFDKKYPWNLDNFGPIYIPKKGATINLNMNNLPFYERLIKVYEGNALKVQDGKIFVNGAAVDTYTFAMDYYWLMGDNRHNSADSRFWGFVPEDHVVGKASFVWLSLDPEKSLFGGKIRWNKLFRVIR